MSEFPRGMTGNERDVLDFLLSAEFPGVEELRAQASFALVTGLCDCGCPSFGLTVDKSKAPRADVNPKTPVEAQADSIGDDPSFELLLFTNDGWLDYVELVTYDPVRSTFPPLTQFHPARQLR
jgi:hypothetical protein